MGKYSLWFPFVIGGLSYILFQNPPERLLVGILLYWLKSHWSAAVQKRWLSEFGCKKNAKHYDFSPFDFVVSCAKEGNKILLSDGAWKFRCWNKLALSIIFINCKMGRWEKYGKYFHFPFCKHNSIRGYFERWEQFLLVNETWLLADYSDAWLLFFLASSRRLFDYAIPFVRV